MKKSLSLLLVFVMLFSFAGIIKNVKAAEGDATVYFHINQFDGDYTNTGIGIWDGIDWNGWGGFVTSTDDFGGVVEFVIPAAKLADGNLMDLIQLEITRSVTASDDAGKQAGYLSPGDGKVFADITSLKDGSKTELHVYYMEGAEDVFIPRDGFGVIFVSYMDPKIAANEAAYDGWNIWTWNNGTDGTEAGADGHDFDMDMTVEGPLGDTVYEMPMKLAILEVADDPAGDSGFIVRTADWAKQCGTDIMIPNDGVAGMGAVAYYYQAGSCELETDGAAYLADITSKFDMNAGNRILEGTVTDPTTVELETLFPKNPAAYDLSRFELLDSNGTMIPIDMLHVGGTEMLGMFTSTLTCVDANYFVLYLNTSLDVAKIGVVGGIQGWDPSSAVTSSGLDSNGNAVFEACSVDAMGGFKVLYDADDNGFNWGDVELTPVDISFDMSMDMSGVYYVAVEDVMAEEITPTVSLTGEIEKYVKVFVDTTLPHDELALAGSHQGWAPENGTLTSGIDSFGNAVFEFIADSDAPEFKLLHDADANGFNWGDVEVTGSANIALDLTGVDSQTIFIASDGSWMVVPEGVVSTEVFAPDYGYIADTTCQDNLVTVFVNTAYDISKVGLVGGLQGWNPDAAIISTKTTVSGLHVFEACTTEVAGGFKLLFDGDDNGFNWGDVELTPSDLPFDVANSLGYEVYGATLQTGSFTPVVTPVQEIFNLVRVYVNTDVPHAELGLVGSFQGWDPANALVSTMDDANGLAYFEIALDGADLTFKILHDSDANGFSWEDVSVTEDQVFEGLGSVNNIYVRNAEAVLFNMEHQFVPATNMSLDSTSITLTVAEENALMYGEDYTVKYLDKYGNDVDPDMVIEYAPLMINVSNEFVAGSPVEGTGTFAVLPEMILVDFGVSVPLFDNLMLKDSMGNEVVWDFYTPANMAGAYNTETVCEEGNNLLFIHVGLTDTMPAELAQLGIVGTINGWDIENAITASGMDEFGNYVFEVCLADTETAGEFKVKFDPDGDGFTWDSAADPEVTPSNIAFEVANGPTFFVEELASAVNVTSVHAIVLTTNPLDNTKEYVLEFVDQNGFVVTIDVDMDTEAPVADYAVIPDMDFEIDNESTFNLMDYFTKLQFLDNREGELTYEIETDLDLNVLGEQTVVVKATDMWNNVGTAEFVFTVTDITDPTITGTDEITVTVGDAEPTWTDYASSDDGTITVNTSQVDMSIDGEFYVIFTATDGGGNTASHTLKVIVEAAEVVDPGEKETPDSGCFSSIESSITSLAIISIVIGGAAVLYIKRR